MVQSSGQEESHRLTPRHRPLRLIVYTAPFLLCAVIVLFVVLGAECRFDVGIKTGRSYSVCNTGGKIGTGLELVALAAIVVALVFLAADCSRWLKRRRAA